MDSEKRVALLIDADNISASYCKLIIDEVSDEGVIGQKRIYGDWGASNLGSWKNAIIDNALNPIQQIRYTTGKNATDSAMIIDAMDILYGGNVDSFCIVSSDSDFTKLAIRLRESGMFVMGMGEAKTPKSFVAACNKFKYLDVLQKNIKREEHHDNHAQQEPEPAEKESSVPPFRSIRKAIVGYLESTSDDMEWVLLGTIGHSLTKLYPGFDSRNYGFKKLSDMLKNIPQLEVRGMLTSQSPIEQLHVRVKP